MVFLHLCILIISTMIDPSSGFVTPDKYTPVTSAVIFRHDRENLPVIPFAVPKPEPVGNSFEPKYQAMSARERKLRDLNGSTGSKDLGPIPPRNLASLGSPEQSTSSVRSVGDARKQTSDLVPTSINWSFPLSPQIPQIHQIDAKNVRRQQTNLIPATMPWTTSMSPVVPSQSQESEHRKQSHDLLPVTMPWTTQISSSNPGETMDYRRRKVVHPEEESHGKNTKHRADSDGRGAVELIRYKIGGVPLCGNEESVVRKVFTQSGIHVVETKAQIDILSNRCKGVVELVIRDDGCIGGKDRICEVAENNGLKIVH